MTEEQLILDKYNRQLELGRARSKRNYEKNKEKILSDRKESRQTVKKKLIEFKEKNAIQNIVVEPEPEHEPVFDKSDIKVLTLEDCLNLIQNSDYTISSKTTYLTDIKRFFKLSKCINFQECFQKPQHMIDVILESDFAINTKKQTLQIIIILIDKFSVFKLVNISKKQAKKVRDLFQYHFDEYKEKSNDLNQERAKMKIPSFNQYLSKVTAEYNKNSKEYLIILLYSVLTLRDNFKAMKIIQNKNENDETNNFLLLQNVNNKTNLTFIVNNYKTKGRYDKFQFAVPTGELKTKLLDWISFKKLNYGDYLFGKSSLSSFISNLNKTLFSDTIGGVNLLRHIRVSETDPNLSFEERNKLAANMLHSMATQKKYRQQIIVIDDETN
jgi:hypothetical protein